MRVTTEDLGWNADGWPNGVVGTPDGKTLYVNKWFYDNKGGTWVNYNVEAVRAGMGPYFPKYGQSRRFHPEFVAAQEEARKAKERAQKRYA